MSKFTSMRNNLYLPLKCCSWKLICFLAILVKIKIPEKNNFQGYFAEVSFDTPEGNQLSHFKNSYFFKILWWFHKAHKTDLKNWPNRFWKNVMIVGTKWSFHSKDEATRASKNPAVTVDSWSKNIRTALRSSLKKKIPVSNYKKFAFCKKKS